MEKTTACIVQGATGAQKQLIRKIAHRSDEVVVLHESEDNLMLSEARKNTWSTSDAIAKTQQTVLDSEQKLSDRKLNRQFEIPRVISQILSSFTDRVTFKIFMIFTFYEFAIVFFTLFEAHVDIQPVVLSYSLD